MKNPELIKGKVQIDSLFKQVRIFSSDPSADPEIVAMLTYYLCVKVSGFVETSIRTILMEYAEQHSSDKATKFIEKRLERFPNPSMSTIVELIKSFGDVWAKDFKNKVDETSRTALENINKNRNAIAHGGVSSITLRELENYYNEVITIIQQLEAICV